MTATISDLDCPMLGMLQLRTSSSCERWSVLEGQNMKFSSILRLKKIQILKWERGTSCSGSGATLGSVERRPPVKCCQGSSCLGKQLVWRLKSQWKPALKWKRSSTTTRYSYDPRSYSQNFDDGFRNEHRSPLCSQSQMSFKFANRIIIAIPTSDSEVSAAAA